MQNLTVEVSELPNIKMLARQPLATHYKLINLIVRTAVFLVLIVISFIGREPMIANGAAEFKAVIMSLPIVLIVIGLIFTTYQWFADKAKFFAVRQHDISFFSGLLFRRLVTQPISRIQHVEVSQGPLDRIAELGKLQVYSAGSGMQTFAIPGLPIDLAHQLRQQLSHQLDEAEDPKTDE